MKKFEQINPIDLINDLYRDLRKKFDSSFDDQEKKVIFRRLVNLRGVRRFLASARKGA